MPCKTSQVQRQKDLAQIDHLDTLDDLAAANTALIKARTDDQAMMDKARVAEMNARATASKATAQKADLWMQQVRAGNISAGPPSDLVQQQKIANATYTALQRVAATEKSSGFGVDESIAQAVIDAQQRAQTLNNAVNFKNSPEYAGIKAAGAANSVSPGAVSVPSSQFGTLFQSSTDIKNNGKENFRRVDGVYYNAQGLDYKGTPFPNGSNPPGIK